MSIRILDHINIATPRLEETRQFFVDVLGLAVGRRPPTIASTGYWLYAGDRPIVHIQATGDEVGPSSSSALSHFAFEVDEIDGLIERLSRHGVPFRAVEIAGTAIRQAFFQDPNGVQIELNYNGAAGGA